MAFNLVVTGNDGIGLAIGRRALAVAGTKVVFAARRSSADVRLVGMREVLEGHPGRSWYVGETDVAKPDAVDRLKVAVLPQLGDEAGRKFYVVANAGVEIADDDPTIDLQDEINVDGARNTFNAFREVVRERGGMLASMSSVVAAEGAPLPTRHRYAATKREAINIAFAARELLPVDQRVPAFAIAPGAIMTGMIQGAPLLGMMLVAAAGRAKTELSLGETLARLVGEEISSMTGADLLRRLIGAKLMAASADFERLLGMVAGKDADFTGKRSMTLGARLMKDPAGPLANRTRELLLATKLVIPPEDVAEAVVAQLVANEVPEGGILKVYGHPAVAGLVKSLSTLLA